MTMTSGKKTMPITYLVQPGHIRYEAQPDPSVTSVGLLDVAAGTITVLMVEQKMYMQLSLPKNGKLDAETTFEETGRTETIAGHACTEYVLREKKTTTEIWATTELGSLANLAEAFGRRGKSSAWEEEMARRGLFALRVVTKNRKGAETSRLECLKVSPEAIDDSLFKIPADYTRMPGLGDLLGR